ncbi:MAG TPA: O-antigen polysaccharide polymerase Wzy [Terracidiphilus sp.]|jgi:oligosaccharide repeat unit polymerase
MTTATEATLLLSAVLIATLAVLCHWVDLTGCLWISLALYALLVYLAWRRFGGGRHPCFLFLGMILLFQMGRLIGYVAGAAPDPFEVVVQTLLPLQVSAAASEITLLIILLSATCVYAVCSWNVAPVTLRPGAGRQWLRAAYALLALTFPFVLYKNYEYLQFIRSHGGYLAIFTQSQDVAESAGGAVRLLSLFAYNAFLLVYVLERNGKRLAWVTTAFLSTSVLELAIGMRGKVFLFLITLWFLRNLKTGRKFRLGTLVAVALAGSFLAVAISGFREMRSTALIGPAGFVVGQGISMGVTQIAVEDRQLFAPHVRSYMESELLQAFYSAPHFGQGELFDNDISVYLNAAAYRQGFGAGSSYLAEAWIAGGIAGVIVASVLIGLLLRWLHTLGRHWIGAVAVAILLPSVIYLPRAQMLSPLATALKNGIAFVPMIPCLWFLRYLLELFDNSRPEPVIESGLLRGPIP